VYGSAVARDDDYATHPTEQSAAFDAAALPFIERAIRS
jgi:hypothetical protein